MKVPFPYNPYAITDYTVDRLSFSAVRRDNMCLKLRTELSGEQGAQPGHLTGTMELSLY